MKKVKFTEEQIAYLNGLESDKEKSKFLLDCVIENVENDYAKSEKKQKKKEKEKKALKRNIERIERCLSKELTLDEIKICKIFCVENDLFDLASKFRDKQKDLNKEAVEFDCKILSLNDILSAWSEDGIIQKSYTEAPLFQRIYKIAKLKQ